jgi:hypothetical protein
MQVIYNYMPETNRISMVYRIAAVLYLQLMLLVVLFPMLNMCCTFTLVLSEVILQCQIWLFFVVP